MANNNEEFVTNRDVEDVADRIIEQYQQTNPSERMLVGIAGKKLFHFIDRNANTRRTIITKRALINEHFIFSSVNRPTWFRKNISCQYHCKCDF